MNLFMLDEIHHILIALGAQQITPYHGGYRSTCCIHAGDNPRALAVWVDRDGAFRVSCHSRHCVTAAMIEWVVAKTLALPISDAVEWLARLLGRPLTVPDYLHSNTELSIVESTLPDIQYDDPEMLARLQKMYPYHDYWKSRGYNQAAVEEFGFTYRSLDHRAIIPIYDEYRQLLGVVSRATLADDPVKYKWESPNSTKTRWLYGVPNATRRGMIVEGRRVVFLVEGTLDVVKPTMAGFPCVSSQTNKLSAAQALDLLDNWDLVIVIPDQDEAGRELVKDVNQYCSAFMDVAVVTLPEGFKDPDSLDEALVSSLFNRIIQDWRTTWQSASRLNRSKPMYLNLNR